MTSRCAQETVAYQAYLEARRTLRDQHADHDDLEQADEDVAKARAAMEVAWLDANATTTR